MRLPDGMRERVSEVSRLHHRSMNSEIVVRLEQSLMDPSTEQQEVPMSTALLSNVEAKVIAGFRNLHTNQQRALLEIIMMYDSQHEPPVGKRT